MKSNPEIFSDRELSLLQAMVDEQVPFMMVGLSAAVLFGAPVVTQDVDLWVPDLNTRSFQKALQSVGAIFVPSFGHNPPSIAGKGFGLFDLVMTMSGLGSFEEELPHSEKIDLGGCTVPVLSLERIIASKEAANREKDKLVLPVLRDALKTRQITGKR